MEELRVVANHTFYRRILQKNIRNFVFYDFVEKIETLEFRSSGISSVGASSVGPPQFGGQRQWAQPLDKCGAQSPYPGAKTRSNPTDPNRKQQCLSLELSDTSTTNTVCGVLALVSVRYSHSPRTLCGDSDSVLRTCMRIEVRKDSGELDLRFVERLVTPTLWN